MNCGTCAHGKHLMGATTQQSLGFVACTLVDQSEFHPAARACVTGKWREVVAAPAPAKAAPKRSSTIESEDEVERWWAATGK
jgi:hypothetical protein